MATRINGQEVELTETVYGVEFTDSKRDGGRVVMECESEEQARFYATFMEDAKVVASLVYCSVWAPVT